MAISEEKLRDLILDKFPGADIDIVDLVGDRDHYQITVTSAAFNGKTLLAQHKMINEALKDYLGGKLHALSIKTKAK